MIVYVPVGNGPTRRAYIAAGAGIIVQANKFRFPKLECPWIVDNGAFEAFKNGDPWDADKFLETVERLLLVQPCERPEWCLAPDIVASSKSLGFSVSWRKDLPSNLRWYLALQDGMSPVGVENALASAQFNGLFVGGSMTWKAEKAGEWCAFGRAHGLPVHIGRANGGRRLQWAINIGADSLDGTGWPKRPEWVNWIRTVTTPERRETLLFDDVVGRAS